MLKQRFTQKIGNSWNARVTPYCTLLYSMPPFPCTHSREVGKFLISDFRRDLNIVYFLLGISPASNCSWPTFRNPVSVPSSKAGCTVVRPALVRTSVGGIKYLASSHTSHCTPSLWRWNWYGVPKRRPTTIWRRGNTQKKIYKLANNHTATSI